MCVRHNTELVWMGAQSTAFGVGCQLLSSLAADAAPDMSQLPASQPAHQPTLVTCEVVCGQVEARLSSH